MSRLQKKCLMASAGMHGFLLLVLLVGSAFFVPKEKKVVQTSMKVVPSMLVDDLLSGGGGDPKVQAQPNERQKGQVLEPPKPQPEVKRAEPKPQPKPAPKPAPQPKPKPKPEPKPEPKPVAKPKPKPQPKPPEKLVLKRVSDDRKKELLSKPEPKPTPAPAPTPRRDISKDLKQVDNVLNQLQGGFSDGTSIKVHGPGGAAYASFDQFVIEVYRNAWNVPAEMDDDRSIVKVEVTISRTGTVLSSKVVRYSGKSALDRSVDSVLRRVRTIGRPFPQSATDTQRTYTIDFNLMLKRA